MIAVGFTFGAENLRIYLSKRYYCESLYEKGRNVAECFVNEKALIMNEIQVVGAAEFRHKQNAVEKGLIILKTTIYGVTVLLVLLMLLITKKLLKNKTKIIRENNQ